MRTIAKEGQAWFVAKDVCDILEIGDPSKAVDRLEEDETVDYYSYNSRSA